MVGEGGVEAAKLQAGADCQWQAVAAEADDLGVKDVGAGAGEVVGD
jgi:hypothetical protein